MLRRGGSREGTRPPGRREMKTEPIAIDGRNRAHVRLAVAGAAPTSALRCRAETTTNGVEWREVPDLVFDAPPGVHQRTAAVEGAFLRFDVESSGPAAFDLRVKLD